MTDVRPTPVASEVHNGRPGQSGRSVEARETIQIGRSHKTPISRHVEFRSGENVLNGRITTPASGAPKAIAVLNGATGVPASYYKSFAHWIANSQGIACLTYDYRDFGASTKGSIRKSRATLTDWAVYDSEAARAFAKSQFEGVPLWVIGHSLGALCLPFQRNLDQIDRVIAIGAGPGNLRDHPPLYRLIAGLFWYGHGPFATALLGYLPGWAFGNGQDLPRGVFWQWRRWCISSDFFARDIGTNLPVPDWNGIRSDLKLVAIADDPTVPPSAIWRLAEHHLAARKTQLLLRPADFGLNSIGHIGVLSRRGTAAWDEILR